jgi:integral membrane protein (TIGR00529 family)
MLPAWLSFIIIIGIVIILSKYELGITLSIGAIGFALLAGANILQSLINVVTNPTALLLMVIVTLISILGGIMEESGLMMEMIQKMRISRKTSLMVIPALYGLLPVAGGALMSAPIVEQIDSKEEASKKVSINVWYRHMLIIIYPLSSSLIVASDLTGINLYLIVLGLLPCLIIMWLVGYLTLIKDVSPFSELGERDLRRAFHNMIPIIIAPIIDIVIRVAFDPRIPEIFLCISLIFSIGLALRFGNMKISNIKNISKRMKIWRFPLIIFAMYIFLEVFELSGAREEIGSLNLSVFLLILIGFLLGFGTGRILLPVSILIPIYGLTIPFLDLIFIYVSISIGYLITPIHPCVTYSTDYFETDFKKVVKVLGKPILISFIILIGFYWLFFLLI